jgi:hypothetical protein
LPEIREFQISDFFDTIDSDLPFAADSTKARNRRRTQLIEATL